VTVSVIVATVSDTARLAVRVRLADENGDVCLEVGDNGKGISLERLSAASSLGIVGMRERALLLGGELTINGVPGKGTTVRVRIPKIRNDEPQSADSAAKGAPRATA